MKKYTKPRILALSLDTNETICAACDIDAIGAHMHDIFGPIYEAFGVNPDNLDDVRNCFNTAEKECVTKIPYEEYCKHNPEGGKIAFDSI